MISDCPQVLIEAGHGVTNRRTFVNDALKADDREQSAGNGGGGNGTEDNETQQTAGVAARLALEEEVGTARGRDFGGHGGGVSCWVGGISGGREVLVALKGVQW